MTSPSSQLLHQIIASPLIQLIELNYSRELLQIIHTSKISPSLSCILINPKMNTFSTMNLLLCIGFAFCLSIELCQGQYTVRKIIHSDLAPGTTLPLRFNLNKYTRERLIGMISKRNICSAIVKPFRWTT